jgi:hypothetical protein
MLTLLIARTIRDLASSLSSSDDESLASSNAVPVSRISKESSAAETSMENSSSRNIAIKVARHNDSNESNIPGDDWSSPELIAKPNKLKQQGNSNETDFEHGGSQLTHQLMRATSRLTIEADQLSHQRSETNGAEYPKAAHQKN